MSDLVPPGNEDRATLKWPVAAGIVGALLVVVLGGGWLLSRAARQTLGRVVPAAPAAATTRPVTNPVPVSVSVSVPVTAASSTTRTTATAGVTGTPGTTRTAGITGTTGIAVAVGTVVDPTGPHASVALRGVTLVPLPTVQPTAPPRGWWDASSDVPEDERVQVEQAYAHYWAVRSQALLELDGDRLTEIMAGAELTAEQQSITDLRASGRAERVVVEHAERVTWATADAATILDEYVSHTVQVDAETKEPLEDPPTAPFRLAYLFRKVDGRWLAVDSVRVIYAP